jgi:hypothetical protein
MRLIDDYLNNPQPGYAVLISGDWGVGKSFQWQAYARQLNGRMSPITFSAAGLQTNEELERALFQASIEKIVGTPVAEVGAVLGRALLRVAKINPDDITWKADLTRDKTVVCIDDVERFAGKFSVLFGFIVSLIDASGVHCVLIADEIKAKEAFKDYATTKERIVGKTIKLSSNAQAFSENIIRGFLKQGVRDALLGNIDSLMKLVDDAHLVNLRTVRLFLTELGLICDHLPEASLPHLFQSHLPSAVLFWTRAVSREAGSERIAERVFLSEDIGIALAMREMARQKGTGPDEPDALSDLLSELGLSEIVHSWPASQAFVDHMEGREVVDYRQLAVDFDLRDAARPYDPIEAINRYATRSDAEVQSAITIAREQFHQLPQPSLMRLHGLYRALYFMSVRGVFEVEPEQWTKEALDRLHKFLVAPEGLSEEHFESWPDRYDENERAVIAKLQELEVARSAVTHFEERKKALQTLLDPNGGSANGETSPIFTAAPEPELFLEELRRAGVPAVMRLKGVFQQRLRISNAHDFVSADRDYSEALAQCIDKNVSSERPLSLLDAELRSAIDPLRQFVAQMGRAARE